MTQPNLLLAFNPAGTHADVEAVPDGVPATGRKHLLRLLSLVAGSVASIIVHGRPTAVLLHLPPPERR